MISRLFATIWRDSYETLGKDIAESGREGKDWYFIVGNLNVTFRKIYIENIVKITKE